VASKLAHQGFSGFFRLFQAKIFFEQEFQINFRVENPILSSGSRLSQQGYEKLRKAIFFEPSHRGTIPAGMTQASNH